MKRTETALVSGLSFVFEEGKSVECPAMEDGELVELW
jgi:hypothetical protein